MSQQTTTTTIEEKNGCGPRLTKFAVSTGVLLVVLCVGLSVLIKIGTALDWIPDDAERTETAAERAATQEIRQATRVAQSTIFAFTATSTPTRTPAPTHTPGPGKVTKRPQWTYHAVTEANLRPCPQLSEACAPIAHLRYGEGIQVTGEINGDAVQGNTRWFQVSHQDQTLYVHSSTVAEVTTAWVTGIETCVHAGAYGELVLPDHINVWKGWGDNRGRIVGEVSHGQRVQILEQRQDKDMDDDRIYYKIRTEDGLEGWLGRDYLQFRPVSEGFDPIEDC
jgi:hypothetical protein